MATPRRERRDTVRSEAPRDGTPLKLLIVTPLGSSVHPLPAAGEVILGRDESCTICIDDLRVSRQHLRIRIDGGLFVSDLGSANGTTLAGRPLESGEEMQLAPGGVLALGSATVVVQSGLPTGRLRHLRSHAYFEARIEDECARVGTSGGTFVVARIQCPPEACLELEAVLTTTLRTMDVVAAYARNHYELLLIDMRREAAVTLLARLREALADKRFAIVTTMAAYPSDGRTAEELLGASARHDSSRSVHPHEEPAAIVHDGAMERLQPIVERVAASAISVIVLGETGVGKEVLAGRIHALSPRAKKCFIGINCAALAQSLLESELFGHERGAFTGAVAAKAGILESADGGTVFLDEVAEMSLAVQAKLLRVLEQREVMRLGAVRALAIDVRVIAATNRDLEDAVHRGSFREDLYFRLNGITVVVPPLRERVREIEPLARAFLVRFCKENGRKYVPRLSGEVMGLLNRYAWPGNVRELRNAMERAAVLCAGETILLDHLPHEKMGRVLATRASRPRAAAEQREPGDLRATLPPPSGAHTRATRTKDHRLVDAGDERHRILQALESCAGNQTEAAQLLGMSRRTLVNRLAEYRMPRPRKPPAP